MGDGDGTSEIVKWSTMLEKRVSNCIAKDDVAYSVEKSKRLGLGLKFCVENMFLRLQAKNNNTQYTKNKLQHETRYTQHYIYYMVTNIRDTVNAA